MNINELLKCYAAGQTDFSRIVLNEAKLSKAKLPFIVLTEAILRGADFSGAHLPGAEFIQANLHHAKLVGANLIGSDLFRANLQGANLTRALLSGANLVGTNLSQANLEEVSLSGADLSTANLRGANLKNANLRGANLRSANLCDADLTKADLENADLTGATMPNGERLLTIRTTPGDLLSQINPLIQERKAETLIRGIKSSVPSSQKDDITLELPRKQATNNIGAKAGWLAAAQERIGSANPSNSQNEEEAKVIVRMFIGKRRGQDQFRQKLLKLYNGRCAVTGCDAEPVLEIAYLLPQVALDEPYPCQALLLRADLHTLFDLNLLTINPRTITVLLAPNLQNTSYGELMGRSLQLPKNQADQPSPDLLDRHCHQCEWLKKQPDFLINTVLQE